MATQITAFRKTFEKELRAKLLQKSNSKMSEEACLVKMFKFFDILDRGAVNLAQFNQALEKIGFYYPDEQIRSLYLEYDKDHNDLLDYKEFTQAIFGTEANNKGACARHDHPDEHVANQLVEAFRSKLLLRGARSVIGIARTFRIADDDRSGRLNFSEFQKCLIESKINMTIDDVRSLFSVFDINRDGSVSYDEFIRVVRGDMNEMRSELVKKAFEFLDKDGSGIVDFRDICEIYDASKNPAVIDGRKTEQQVLTEFLETFEMHKSQNPDGKVTPEEFEEYYANISASIDDDAYFKQMINSSWNLDKQASTYAVYDSPYSNAQAAGKSTGFAIQKRGYSPTKSRYVDSNLKSGLESVDSFITKETTYFTNDRRSTGKRQGHVSPKKAADWKYMEAINQESNDNTIHYKATAPPQYNNYVVRSQRAQEFPTPNSSKTNKAQQILEINRFREALSRKGHKAMVTLKRQFAIADQDGSGALDMTEFENVIRDYRIPGVSVNDSQRLFTLFDQDKNGCVNFNEVMLALCADFPEKRLRIVNECFDKLDKNANGILELEEVKSRFDASRDPLVVVGLKSENHVRDAFFDMFEKHHEAETHFSGETAVTRQAFILFFRFMSPQFEKDAEFHNHLIGTFNMDIVPVGGKEYPGKHTDVYGKNSREQWKFDFHKPVFGEITNKDTPYKFSQEQLNAGQDKIDVGVGRETGLKPAAGHVKTWDINGTKKAHMIGSLGTKATGNHQPLQQTGPNVLERVRQRIMARGARGIIGIGRSFRIIDDDGSRSLNLAEFRKCLGDYRISNDREEQDFVFQMIDRNGSGSIDYEEFLRMVRGDMNQFRQNLVREAFGKIDTDGNGILNITDIKAKYNAKMHPDVQSGKRSEDDILYEFLDTFEQFYDFNGDSKNANHDRQVTPEEFIQYYENISCSIDNDQYFELMMVNAWNLNDTKPANKAVGFAL